MKRTAYYYVRLVGNDHHVYRTDDHTNCHAKVDGPFSGALAAWSYIKQLVKGTTAEYTKLPSEMHAPGDPCLRQCFMIMEETDE